MNTQGGPLEFEYDIRLENMQAKLKSIESQLMGMGQNVAKQGNIIDKAWAMSMASVAGYFTGRTLVNFVQDIFTVRAEFQKLEAVLTNAFGDESAAKRALSMIQEFAAKTPYQVTDLTSSFVKLVNQGFTPTYEEMTKLGDLASSTGKGFDQLTEAIIDAQTFEFERLKEFGVRAKKEGDKITFTFKEQETQVQATSEEVRKYIVSLGGLAGVAGTMESVSKTLGGQVSNLGDAWDRLLNTLGGKSEGVFSSAMMLLIDLIVMIEEGIQSVDQIREKVAQKAAEVNIQEGVKQVQQLEKLNIEAGKKADEARLSALQSYQNNVEATIQTNLDLEKKASEELYDMYAANSGLPKRKQPYTDAKLEEQKRIVEQYTQKVKDLRAELAGVIEWDKSSKPTKTKVTPDDKDPLKTFESNLKKEKELYQQYENAKVVYGEKKAKELYPKLLDTYKDYLLKLRSEYANDPPYAGAISNELAPIFNKEQLQEMPRVEAFYEKQNKAQATEVTLSARTRAEQDKKHRSLMRQAEAAQDLRTEWEKERDLMQNILSISGELLSIFSQLTSESSQAGMAMSNLANSLQSKSVAEGFIKFGLGVVKDWINTSKELKEQRIQSDIDQVSASLVGLSFQLERADNAFSVEKPEEYRKALTDVYETAQILEKQFNKLGKGKTINWFKDFKLDYNTTTIEDLEKLIETFTAIQNTEDKKENKANKQRLDMLEQMLKLKKQELEIEQQINETLTGTTAEAIADSIAKGFENGYNSVEKFSEDMSNSIKAALIQSFKAKYIEQFTASWYAKFVKAAQSDGELTQREIDYLTQNYQLGVDNLIKQWDANWKPMFDSLGISSGNETSLSKSFQGLTEDTGDVIAGQMNAIKVTSIQIRDIMQSGLIYWQRIDLNTGSTAKLSADIVLALGAINQKMNDNSADRASGL